VTSAARKTLIVTLIGVAVTAVVAWQVVALLQPRKYAIESATIISLDPQTRRGEIAFVHPKSGSTMTVAGQIAPDCEITINGVPAALQDLRVGDTVAVSGTVYADHTVRPDWVRVRRDPPAATPDHGAAPPAP
jgi:hypothetical protein